MGFGVLDKIVQLVEAFFQSSEQTDFVPGPHPFRRHGEISTLAHRTVLIADFPLYIRIDSNDLSQLMFDPHSSDTALYQSPIRFPLVLIDLIPGAVTSVAGSQLRQPPMIRTSSLPNARSAKGVQTWTSGMMSMLNAIMSRTTVPTSS
jgi:hypothetical protein